MSNYLKINVPLILHDETLDRTTNGTGFLKDFTYADLRKLDAGQGEKIPSLEEFLEFAKDSNIYINLELKNSIINYENLENIILDNIYKFGLKEKVIISSFNHLSMMKIKDLDKSIKNRSTIMIVGLTTLLIYCLSCNVDALHHIICLYILDKKYLQSILNRNISVNCYTVNNEEDMLGLRLTCSSIITK